MSENNKNEKVLEKNETRTDSVVFYYSFYEGIKDLNDKDFAQFFRAFCEYSFFKNEINVSKKAQMAFTFAKPLIDASLAKKARSVRGGKISAETKNTQKTGEIADSSFAQVALQNAEQNCNAKKSTNVNVNSNVNSNVNTNINVNSNSNDNEDVNKPDLTLGEKWFIDTSHHIFDMLEQHGFPCDRKYSSFVGKLYQILNKYSSKLTFSDLDDALKNYFLVFDDPQCYPVTVYTLEDFINSPFFDLCNVSNFNKDNFLKFGLDKPQDLSKGLPGWPTDCVR